MLRLSFYLFFVFNIAFAQTSQNEIREYINKNEILLRTIHKHMFHYKNLQDINLFKNFLRYQMLSIHYFGKDDDKSIQFAKQLRKEGYDFLKKHTNSDLTYYDPYPLDISNKTKYVFSEMELEITQKINSFKFSNNPKELDNYTIKLIND